jgi:hypothetical protein
VDSEINVVRRGQVNGGVLQKRKGARVKKRFLKSLHLCLIALVMVPCLTGHVWSADVSGTETFGAEENPTGAPIGGGKGYPRLVGKGDYTVETREQLLMALGKAKAGQVVYVRDDSEIDLTGHREIVIPEGVTLASGRGRNDSKGALFFTTEDKYTKGESERFCLFMTGGPNVRVTGIRLRGPDPDVRGRYQYINSDGIQCHHDALKVDNCEIWAWSHGGVYAIEGTGVHVHHNFIHHCQRAGLGYCVVLNKAELRIEANIFDYYRHAIAATGRSPSGYEACYNIARQHSTSHVFDMHGGRDRKDGTNVAGDWMKIHHNTFHSRHRPVVVRGRPTKECVVHNNWFLQARTPGDAVKHGGNTRVYRNWYTESKTLKE